MKYYMKLINSDIEYFGRGKKIPKNCIEITEDQYEDYMKVLDGIPDREGYYKIVHLHVNMTYEVEYVIFEEEE